jgi:hypothetical protein
MIKHAKISGDQPYQYYVINRRFGNLLLPHHQDRRTILTSTMMTKMYFSETSASDITLTWLIA